MSIYIALLGAFVIGMSKSGLKGITIFIVILMAFLYGAKASTGIVLPLLIFGDILAVIYYNRHAKWKLLKVFLPTMFFGVIVAAYAGKDMPEEIFKKGMAIIVLVSVLIMVIWEKYKPKNIPQQTWFSGSLGFTAGFTTMIGNLAGAFSNIFFLALRIPKSEFIGTAAWLYLIVNTIKLPFHIIMWKTITWESLKINLVLFPAIILGFAVGFQVVKRINDTLYRKFILVMTAVGAIVLLLR